MSRNTYLVGMGLIHTLTTDKERSWPTIDLPFEAKLWELAVNFLGQNSRTFQANSGVTEPPTWK
jgi:hypothetical protein